MAYGLKYELLCASKKGHTYKLRLLFDGYVGAQIDRDIPAANSFILRKDKAATIRGTSCEFGIRESVDFEMDEFYTNNPKKIKAELYDGSTLIWTGYNLPQQYQADYIPAPVSISFVATDGLGLLKNVPFNLTGQNSQLATIKYCIDTIGLGLGYSIAINLFETNHVTNRSPLEQTYIDSAVYNGMDCYTVIEKILGPYNAEITQVNAKWYITRNADKKSTRMLYTSAGVYSTTEAALAVLDLGYPDTAGIEAWPVGRLSRKLEPGAKQVTIKFDFGRKASLLDNYQFWRFSGGQFANWTQSGSFTLIQGIKDGKAYALLPSYTNNANDRIDQQIPISNATGDDFVFEVDFAPIGRTSGSNFGYAACMMTVRMVIALTDGTTTYYLTETGWTTTLSMISKVVNSSLMSPIWNRLKIMTAGLPISGTILVSLYRYYLSTAPRPGDSYSGIAYSEPLVYFLHAGDLYPSGLETVAVFDNSTEPDDLGEIDIQAADAPAYINKAQLFSNITRLSNGTPTSELWHEPGSSVYYSQIVQFCRSLASDNRIARQSLTGIIKGVGINLNSIIKHSYNGNREFEIAEAQWDMYNESWQVTLLELLAWSDEQVTFSTTNNNQSTTSTVPSGGSVIGVGLGNEGGINSAFAQYFELVNPGASDQYLRCKLPFAGDYEIQAYTNTGSVPSAWVGNSFTTWHLNADSGFTWGAGDLVAANNDTLKLVAGTNITIQTDPTGKALKINSSGGGGGTWGSITGTLSAQTDLQSALNAKISSQWTTTGSDIYFANKVKIGDTNVPLMPLHTTVPYSKTDISQRAIAFFSSNEVAAYNPFGFRISVYGGSTTANRTISLQTTEYSLIDGGTLSLQMGGGNVGIGIATALGKLHLDAGMFWLTGMTAVNANIAGVGYYGGNNGGGIFSRGSAGYGDFGIGNSFFNFLQCNGSNGNVGIGTTTTPAAKLDVNGSIHLSGAGLTTPAGALYYGLFPHSGVGLGLYSGAGGISFWTGSTPVQGMILSGSNLTVAGESSAYSDGRVKNIIGKTKPVLPRVMKCQIVDYTRKDIGDGKIRTGQIAQSLRKQFPQYVLGDARKEKLSVNYAEMVNICFKAIQELVTLNNLKIN